MKVGEGSQSHEESLWLGGAAPSLHSESPRRPVSSSLVNTNEPKHLFLCSPVLFVLKVTQSCLTL